MKITDSELFLPTYKLVHRLFEITSKFPKDVRTTLSDKIINNGLNMLRMVNSDLIQRKFDYDGFRLNMANIVIFLRLAKDLRYLSLNQYAEIVDKTIQLKTVLKNLESRLRSI